MGRKSAHGLSEGIQFTSDGFYLATLVGEEARQWRERYPGRSLPRRRVRTLNEAVKAQRALIADLKAGKDPNADNPIIDTYVGAWIASRKKLAASTKRRYTQSWKYQIKPLKLGRLRLRQVNRDHVNEWVNELSQRPREDDPSLLLDPYSIRNAFAVLRAALNTALRDGKIPSNPCIGVELPEADHEEITPLTPDEVDLLLALVDAYELDKATGIYHPHRLAALYHVAIRCGLRLVLQRELVYSYVATAA